MLDISFGLEPLSSKRGVSAEFENGTRVILATHLEAYVTNSNLNHRLRDVVVQLEFVSSVGRLKRKRKYSYKSETTEVIAPRDTAHFRYTHVDQRGSPVGKPIEPFLVADPPGVLETLTGSDTVKVEHYRVIDDQSLGLLMSVHYKLGSTGEGGRTVERQYTLTPVTRIGSSGYPVLINWQLVEG